MRLGSLWTSGDEAQGSALPLFREGVVPLFTNQRDEPCSALPALLASVDKGPLYLGASVFARRRCSCVRR